MGTSSNSSGRDLIPTNHSSSINQPVSDLLLLETSGPIRVSSLTERDSLPEIYVRNWSSSVAKRTRRRGTVPCNSGPNEMGGKSYFNL
jgi:hypothetical protein